MGQAGPAYPAAAKHPVAVVEHRRLARRHCTRRCVENELSLSSVRARVECRRYRRLRRPKLRRYHLAVGRWRSEPIQHVQRNSGFGQCGSWTDDHAPPFGLDLQNVERLAGGDPEPLALPNRETGDAVVTAEHAAGAIDDVTRLASVGPQPLDETGVGSVRHKADILAVGFVRDGQAKAPRRGTGLVLGEAAQWKPQELQLFALRRKQEVALV